MRYSIYKITNLINNKFYIGVTKKKLEKRFSEHSKADSHLGRAIRKYGKENFEMILIKLCKSEYEMYMIEKKWVNEKFVLRPDTYNHMEGGHGGNTIKYYCEERMKIHKEIKSKAVSKIWSEMSEEEKFIRNSKGQKNTNQKIKGSKISSARKKIFLNETEEEKNIRINKAKEGAKKVKKKKCEFCGAKFRPGNFVKHVDACYDNPNSHRFGKRPKKKIVKKYKLTSPDGVIYFREGNIRKISEEFGLSSYLLLKNEGNIVKINAQATNASSLTLGWRLDKI